ncbi:MAG: hypothetical protein WA117_09115 [Verrucomicrobiia bacterium]
MKKIALVEDNPDNRLLFLPLVCESRTFDNLFVFNSWNRWDDGLGLRALHPHPPRVRVPKNAKVFAAFGR